MRKLTIFVLFLFIIGCNENKPSIQYAFLEKLNLDSSNAVAFCQERGWKIASKEQIQDFYDTEKKIINNKLILMEENPQFIYSGLNPGSFTSLYNFGVYYPRNKKIDNNIDRIYEYSMPYLLCVK
ncbi:hypothetical protein [Aliarcobacter butzleri]|uniref:hypothetical protein n=1 Tax=Aliarcobacter butzleri TaxID=28197 RepID=UPI0021B22468|nr:hypothetical protein [Aliarcobacter butzleri]MCT7619156.1 hypothetical protein [Aliarcobacter butzleri]